MVELNFSFVPCEILTQDHVQWRLWKVMRTTLTKHHSFINLADFFVFAFLIPSVSISSIWFQDLATLEPREDVSAEASFGRFHFWFEMVVWNQLEVCTDARHIVSTSEFQTPRVWVLNATRRVLLHVKWQDKKFTKIFEPGGFHTQSALWSQLEG